MRIHDNSNRCSRAMITSNRMPALNSSFTQILCGKLRVNAHLRHKLYVNFLSEILTFFGFFEDFNKKKGIEASFAFNPKDFENLNDQ